MYYIIFAVTDICRKNMTLYENSLLDGSREKSQTQNPLPPVLLHIILYYSI